MSRDAKTKDSQCVAESRRFAAGSASGCWTRRLGPRGEVCCSRAVPYHILMASGAIIRALMNAFQSSYFWKGLGRAWLRWTQMEKACIAFAETHLHVLKSDKRDFFLTHC